MSVPLRPESVSVALDSPEIRALAADDKQRAAIDILSPYAGTIFGSLRRGYDLMDLMPPFFAAVQKTPGILGCTPLSIAQSLVKVARLGLTIGETCHLVPGKDGCEMWMDWRGDVKLMLDSGYVRSIKPMIVREGDVFVQREGTNPGIDHTPTAKSTAPITHAYVIAKLKHGELTWEVMDWDEIDGIRRRSRNATGTPWTVHPGEMAKKTVIHRFKKRIPREFRDRMGDADDDTFGRAESVPAHVFESTPLMGTGHDLYDVAAVAAAPKRAALGAGPMQPVTVVTGVTPAAEPVAQTAPVQGDAPARRAEAGAPAPEPEIITAPAPEDREIPASFPITALRRKRVGDCSTAELTHAVDVLAKRDGPGPAKWVGLLSDVLDDRAYNAKQAADRAATAAAQVVPVPPRVVVPPQTPLDPAIVAARLGTEDPYDKSMLPPTAPTGPTATAPVVPELGALGGVPQDVPPDAPADVPPLVVPTDGGSVDDVDEAFR